MRFQRQGQAGDPERQGMIEQYKKSFECDFEKIGMKDSSRNPSSAASSCYEEVWTENCPHSSTKNKLIYFRKLCIYL